MRYEVNEGRVHTWALEVHVTDHCNLRCANCCTRSPFRPPRFVALEDFRRDLALARTVLRPSVFKLTGGEPLLHPQLAALAHAAREAAIAPTVSLTTNGLLALAADDALWAALDRVQLSRYPSAPLPARTAAHLAERCAAHGVTLVDKDAPSFQVVDAPASHDEATATSTFATCWMRHRCHMLRAGHFFLCTRSPHLLGDEAAAQDGVALDAPRLLDRLLAYLERDEPLAACRRCQGAGGAWQPHVQLRR